MTPDRLLRGTLGDTIALIRRAERQGRHAGRYVACLTWDAEQDVQLDIRTKDDLIEWLLDINRPNGALLVREKCCDPDYFYTFVLTEQAFGIGRVRAQWVN
jgi:hypothetical protein